MKNFTSLNFSEPSNQINHTIKGERRIVTFLFSDIKGSTALAEYLDPEELLEIINGAFKILIDPVVKYEGSVVRLMGDAILAFFGAPISHEDDPARACRAALEIIESSKVFRNKLKIEKGIEDFDVRVGINTGFVVVGNVGASEHFEYTALGDAINTAARMESSAQPGTIHITESTKKYLKSDFQLESLGKLQLKGKNEQINTFRLEGFNSDHPIASDDKLFSPIIGRAHELKLIENAFHQVVQHIGGVVSIHGENGVGKTRLITESKKHLPVNILWTECKAELYEMKNPYWFARKIIKKNIGISNNDSQVQIASKLKHQLSGIDKLHLKEITKNIISFLNSESLSSTEQDGNPEQSAVLKNQFHSSVKEYLKHQARQTPIVLVCDNLQWSDAPSRELLTEIITLTKKIPLLLILAYRLEESEKIFWEYHHHIIDVKDKRNLIITVNSLGADDTYQLVKNLLTVEDLPSDLYKQIYDKTGGNALYIGEVLHSFLDRGVLKKEGGAIISKNYKKEFKVPDLLHNVFMSRIDSLNKIEKYTLQSASVIGRIFKEKLLVQILQEQISNQEIKNILISLQENELILRHLSSDFNNKILLDKEYIFKNPLIHEVVYSTFLLSDRRTIHKRIGETIELQYSSNMEEFVNSLGYHFEQCKEFAKAFTYYIQSGDRAAKYYANEEAIHFYTKAINVSKDLNIEKTQLDELNEKIANIHSMFDFTKINN